MTGNGRRVVVALLCVVLGAIAVIGLLPVFYAGLSRTKATIQDGADAVGGDPSSPQIAWRKGVRSGKFDVPSASEAPLTSAESDGFPMGYTSSESFRRRTGAEEGAGSYEPEYPPPEARHETFGGYPPTTDNRYAFARDGAEMWKGSGVDPESEAKRQAEATVEPPAPPSEPDDFERREDRLGPKDDSARKQPAATTPRPLVAVPEQLRGRLERKLTLAFDDTPLQDVVQFLRETTQTDIVIDESAAGTRAESDNSVTVHVENQSLQDVLAQILDAKGLAYTIKDGVVVIATPESEVMRSGASKTRRPIRYLPRFAYFENTYLGGNAAIAERQHRLDRAWGSAPCPYRLAALGPQAFDAPASDGLALACSLDRTWSEKPGRVMLQIGLRGSDRYGWRRPPLDVIVVVDPATLQSARAHVTEVLVSLVRQLGPQDKLGVTLASSPPRELAAPQRLRDLKASLPEHLAQLPTTGASRAEDLAAALELAGARLTSGAGSGVPGTQTVLFVAATPASGEHVAAAQRAAHGLSLAGVVTSVLDVGGEATSEWWTVAHAGQGNHHRVVGAKVADAVTAELASLARVVARLARVNIRLGPDTKGIRILGSRILSTPEVKEVKAREVATDQQLSRSLGVTSDRGEDDDGLQTVIPYFLGSDAHVILVELMVERPGTVAEVSVRYKDMVRLTNAQLHATVALGHAPRPTTRLQAEVAKNTARFRVAERLQWAAYELARGAVPQALAHLEWAARSIAPGAAERGMVDELYARARTEGRAARVVEAIELAADRLIGQSPAN